MTTTGPVTLRWRGNGSAPETETFPDLDAALDAVEARWETLQHQAPQILDARKILLISTEQLKDAMVEDDETPDGT
ncbi:hypothetical protein J5Y09_00630 [Roseomonas sp. PWR1]|uniref:Uncharacterized protein n=1 Tax=Roseomonas nitratireducens TaxID=2820810 RepID=A0ABS4ANI6_9PROT|nr:hypothetical protein [Neoroseomonas nitratireducens]MBP0462401.1 hypothetical protein [Neoroseomonas nitratireducens]